MLEWSLFGVAIAVILTVFAVVLLRGRMHHLPHPVRFALRMALGVLFVILGILGIFLPVLQAWLFFLLAFLVFFPNHRFAVKACDKIEPKMPKTIARLRRMGVGVHREHDTIDRG